MVAASHSVSVTMKVEFGKPDIPEAWSWWRWVITMSWIRLASRPRSRSCAGMSRPGSTVGFAKRAQAPPMFSAGFAATEG